MSTLAGTARVRATRVAESAVERARLAVVPKTIGRPPQVPFAVLIATALLGGVMGLLAFNTNMAAASFKATELEAREARLEARAQQLQMRLEHLRDPQRLAVAAQNLGMVPLGEPSFLRITDGRVIGNPEVSRKTEGFRVTGDRIHKPRVLRPEPVFVSSLPDDGSGAATADGPRREGKKNQANAG
jgi:hypothetical protein